MTVVLLFNSWFNKKLRFHNGASNTDDDDDDVVRMIMGDRLIDFFYISWEKELVIIIRSIPSDHLVTNISHW